MKLSGEEQSSMSIEDENSNSQSQELEQKQKVKTYTQEEEINYILKKIELKERDIFKVVFVDRRRGNSSKDESKREPLGYSRREKSLEELSKRFLSLFFCKEESMLSLDKITNQLGVERRRIYDIINILESLKLVARKGKNNYKWNGFPKIYATIAEYESQGDLQIEDIQDSPVINNLALMCHKREKSLEMLSIGFLKLFLHWRQVMTLEEAARKLSPQDIDTHKIKTKIRRLYDIANVFKSLGLIQKTSISETKKPAFKWVGTSGLDRFKERIQSEATTSTQQAVSCEESSPVFKHETMPLSQQSSSTAKPAQQQILSQPQPSFDPLQSISFQLLPQIQQPQPQPPQQQLQSQQQQIDSLLFHNMMMKCIINAMGSYIGTAALSNQQQLLSEIVNKQTRSIQAQMMQTCQTNRLANQPLSDLFTAKKERTEVEETDKNYVTPIIKKTLTIIQPRNEEVEMATPKRTLSTQLWNTNSTNKTLMSSNQDIGNLNTTTALKRSNSYSQQLDVSTQSSFKKIKRDFISEYDIAKSNATPSIQLKKSSSFTQFSSSLTNSQSTDLQKNQSSQQIIVNY